MLKERIAKSIRTNIIIGLFLITPLVITLLLVYFLFTFITDTLVPQTWLQTAWAFWYRLAALIAVLGALYLMGLLTRNIFGKSMYRLGDRIMTRIPVIKSIYVALRRVSESLVSTKNVMFKQVVLIQFPRPGVYAIGFLTARLPKDFIQEAGLGFADQDEYVNVFVPTVPNPTSGFLLIAPRREIQPLQISVVNAMKMIISVGAVLPVGTEDLPMPSLLEHLEEWMQPKQPQASSASATPETPLP